MKKTFVLDTNVLLYDPNSLISFEENDVVIPIYVIEEIDHFKKDMSELGRSARHISRTLDKMRQDGSLTEGVELPGGGKLRIKFTEKNIPGTLMVEHNSMDSKILATALAERDSSEQKVVFVSKDTNLRIRADAMGLKTEDFESDKITVDEHYTGSTKIECSGSLVDKLFADGELTDLHEFHPSLHGLYPNQCVHLQEFDNPNHTGLARCVGDTLRPIKINGDKIWGVKARNREQQFALELLMDDDIKLVTLAGKAGTGKTLLAIAAGLQKAAEENIYSKLLVTRPIFPLGRDIGYLPGDIQEKLNPWMKPIFDNVEFLMGLDKDDKKHGRSYKELFDLGFMEIEALTYIRGRSIPKQFMIVDEAQNLTPHEVKTIISRVGDGTKIVLTGDPEQIDNPYVDANNNGLTFVVNRFQDQRIAGHITLVKGERSELAEIATQVLNGH